MCATNKWCFKFFASKMSQYLFSGLILPACFQLGFKPTFFGNKLSDYLGCKRPCHVAYTRAYFCTEVKELWARIVLGLSNNLPDPPSTAGYYLWCWCQLQIKQLQAPTSETNINGDIVELPSISTRVFHPA